MELVLMLDEPILNELMRMHNEVTLTLTRFSQGGAKQLETDLRRGLLPIFGAFTSRPQAHFPLLMVS